MDFINIIKTIVVSVILTVTSFFTPTDKTNTLSPTPSIVIETPTPTATVGITQLSTETRNVNQAITLSSSPTPTPSQDAINKCNGLPHPRNYFNGVKCYPEELKQYLKDKKLDENMMSNLMFREALPLIKNTDTKEKLTNSCLAIGSVAYEHCNGSLTSNIDRFKNQILEIYRSEFEGCLSGVAEGDNETRNLVKDYFWKTIMKEKMDELYSYCSRNNDSFDKYNF